MTTIAVPPIDKGSVRDGQRETVRYGRIAIILHWSMALLIVANLLIGLFQDELEKVIGGSPIPLHKSIGLTVLLLALLRIAWRLAHKPPLLFATDTRQFHRRLASGVHVSLYALMLVMPVSGWIISSAGKYPLRWFGLFAIPKLGVTKADAIVGASDLAHHYLGYLLAMLVVGHIAAALWHRFILQDGVLDRMLLQNAGKV